MNDETDIRVIANNAVKEEIERILSSAETNRKINELIEEKVSNSSDKAVNGLIESEKFQSKVEKTYKSEIRSLISKSESHANKMAGFAVAIFVIIFAAALSWQLAEAREKLSEVVMQHATAVDIVSRLNNTVEKLEKDIQNKISDIDSLMDNSTNRVDTYQIEVSGKMAAIQKELSELRDSLKSLRKEQEAITDQSTRTQ
ncbi:hypothetical protein [Marinobacterium aestuariivivens]|uniref:Uncharacterized protein n=1 Tax=Marinobacterium aestuariivivens TaxID=1698799 RepID=A0ABW2A444_9GAMM